MPGENLFHKFPITQPRTFGTTGISVIDVEKNFILDLDDRARYGVDKSPAIVVLSEGKDTRMRFYGAPTGYEFVPLVEAVLLAGTGNVELADETLKLLASVDKPMHLQVFSTPT